MRGTVPARVKVAVQRLALNVRRDDAQRAVLRIENADVARLRAARLGRHEPRVSVIAAPRQRVPLLARNGARTAKRRVPAR